MFYVYWNCCYLIQSTPVIIKSIESWFCEKKYFRIPSALIHSNSRAQVIAQLQVELRWFSIALWWPCADSSAFLISFKSVWKSFLPLPVKRKNGPVMGQKPESLECGSSIKNKIKRLVQNYLTWQWKWCCSLFPVILFSAYWSPQVLHAGQICRYVMDNVPQPWVKNIFV